MTIGILRFCRYRRALNSGLLRCMERFHKRNERRNFMGTEIFSVSRHITAALDDLPDQLIMRQPRRNRIERWAAHTARSIQTMTIAALFALQHERPAKLQWRAAFDEM